MVAVFGAGEAEMSWGLWKIFLKWAWLNPEVGVVYCKGRGLGCGRGTRKASGSIRRFLVSFRSQGCFKSGRGLNLELNQGLRKGQELKLPSPSFFRSQAVSKAAGD